MMEQNPSALEEKDPAGPLPSLPARVVQVIFSPAAIFDQLKERPVWVGALITLIALSFLPNLLIPEELIRQAVLDQLGSDATEAQIDASMGFATAFRYVGPIVFPPLLSVILAALILLIYNVVLGGEASFSQTFSLSTHALLILVLGSIVTLPLLLARGDLTLVLAPNLLVPGLDTDSYAYRLLSRINLFSLWTAIVLGIGVSRLYPKRSAGSAAGLLIGLYIVFTAVTAGFGS